MKVLYSLFLALGGFSLSVSSPTCNELGLLECINLVDSDAIGKQFKWVQANENIFQYIIRTMDKYCAMTEPVLDCSMDYLNKCPDEDLGSLGVVLKQKQDMVQQVCKKDSTKRQEFLEYIDCLSINQNDILNECEHNLSGVPENNSTNTCEIYWTHCECLYETGGNVCGQNAASLLKLLTGPASAIMKSQCKAENTE